MTSTPAGSEPAQPQPEGPVPGATVPGTTVPGAPPPGPRAGGPLRLSGLLRRPITDRGGESIGRLSDVIVRLRGADDPVGGGAGEAGPPVTGLVAAVGSRRVFVPIDQVASLAGDSDLKLSSARLDLRQFERRTGEVLLRADVLGHRLIDVESARLVRAADLELAYRAGAWVITGVAGHRSRPLLGRHGAGDRTFREWAKFEPLIGHSGSALLRGPFARIRRLKPAQIADLLEGASRDEETEILGQVSADPELEADVFEELDEDLATRLLGARTDGEIAAVLARMQADDAADAVAELPQRRRQGVLDRLPPGPRATIMTLMGYNPTSAGGLMNTDFVALPATATVASAIAAVAGAASLQPEALTSVHVLDSSGRLCGVAKLVTLVQADPATTLAAACDDDPVRVGADTDVVDVAVLMSDYNLTTVPVVDDRRMMLGVITVDDVLEVTLPEDWRRREAAEPPDARHGQTD
ncbi:MAG TPA: CBS domain-containing protein [Streptosporangiaceae bacterium]|nr:CBS domain-containing protein [Streptosporangiaceae bacterium]